MKINHLKICFGNNGRAIVETWVDCYSVEDVDNLIAWLGVAKGAMKSWEKINAKASRAAEAAAGKNEAAEPRKIQSEPQVA